MLGAGLLGACMSGGLVQVHQPTTARPVIPTVTPVANEGAIFQSAAYRPLFEDRRARAIGDTLVITINEKLQASQQSSSTAARTSSATLKVPLIKGFPLKSFQGAEVGASDESKFDGKGDTSSQNLFVASLSVTVIDILQNGNMIVSGEKQIGIGYNAEFLRFSGVVNPATILAGNQVASTNVADARMEYIGRGYIDQAQGMGWMQRFFLSVFPF